MTSLILTKIYSLTLKIDRGLYNLVIKIVYKHIKTLLKNTLREARFLDYA